jgi:hypothetical protein
MGYVKRALEIRHELVVGVISGDRRGVAVLETALDREVRQCLAWPTVQAALQSGSVPDSDGIFIDLASVGISEGISFIEKIRVEHPRIAFCLYGDAYFFEAMPGVSAEWKERFGHYYKLSKQLDAGSFAARVGTILDNFAYYAVQSNARRSIVSIQAKLAQGSKSGIPEADRQQLEAEVSVVEAALEESKPSKMPEALGVAGILADPEVRRLVDVTLAQSTASLMDSGRVHKGVLIFGCLVFISSMVAALVTGDWRAVAFGGLGMSGVVAALVTQPLRSVSVEARRVVQIQLAYLSFLAQVRLLSESHPGLDPLARSERLSKATDALMDSLSATFGTGSATTTAKPAPAKPPSRVEAGS